MRSLLGLMGTRHGLITSAEADAAGVDRDDVRRLIASGAWVRVRTGVYADAEVWAAADEFRGRPLLRMHAARLVLPHDHHVSHDSAALLHVLPLTDGRRSLMHLTRRVHGGRVVAGIKQHRAAFPAEQATVVDGIPALSVARTAVDLAREHGREAGLAAMDAALRSGVRRSELSAVLDGMWCWPGSRTVREMIAAADPGAESYLESAGRLLVLDLGLGRPETQFGLTDGRRTVWCDARLGRHVFEMDGALKLRTRAEGGVAIDPHRALWEEKRRQDFISGFKVGISRITFADCLPEQRDRTLRRLAREYADTVARWGTDLADLAPYVVRGRRPAA